MAVLRECGEKVKDIAEIFGVRRESVTRALGRLSDADRQMIRTIKSAELMAAHHRLARKALSEVLARDFHAKDKSDRYLISEVTLSRIAAIATEKYVELAGLAGMSETQGKRPMNSVMQFLETTQKVTEATRGLPPNVRLGVRQELEVSEDSEPPIEPPWTEESRNST